MSMRYIISTMMAVTGSFGMALPASADSMDVAYDNTIAITSGGMFGNGETTYYYYNADFTVSVVEGDNVYQGTWEYQDDKKGRPGHCTRIPEHKNKFQREICGSIGENSQVGEKWSYRPIFALKLSGEILPGRDGEPQRPEQPPEAGVAE